MLEIEVGDTVRIAATSEYYKHHNEYNPRCEGVCIAAPDGCGYTHDVEWESGKSNHYKVCDLTLVKKGKTMQFTKSDLKTGMFVKQRGGEFKVVLGDVISDDDSWAELSHYNEDMMHGNRTSLDIVAVYTTREFATMTLNLKGQFLKNIWERTEQTEAQKEMEVLQEQAKVLQEQITKLQGKL